MTDTSRDTARRPYDIPDGYPEFEDFLGKRNESNPSADASTAFGKKQKEVLENLAVPVERVKDRPFSVSFGGGVNDKDLLIDPPYGLMGLAVRTKSKEELEKLLRYAEDRSVYFMQMGDYGTSSLFLFRAKFIRGLLDGTTTVEGLPS